MDECYDGNVERIETALLAANEKLLKLEQALAEKDALIERLKARSWTDNVQFIADAKENLLREYIHLTELYGEQKHEIRKLKAAEVEKDREIARLTARIDTLLRAKERLERAYRGYGTPEEEAAKFAAYLEKLDLPEYPETRQRCTKCDEPTGRCEEDTLDIGDSGPLCEECYEKEREAS